MFKRDKFLACLQGVGNMPDVDNVWDGLEQSFDNHVGILTTMSVVTQVNIVFYSLPNNGNNRINADILEDVPALIMISNEVCSSADYIAAWM